MVIPHLTGRCGADDRCRLLRLMCGVLGVFLLSFWVGNRSLRDESESSLLPSFLVLTFDVDFDSYVDQLNQILHYLGTPSEDTLRRVGSPRVSLFLYHDV